MCRLRHKSILETYGLGSSAPEDQRRSNDERYPPVRHRSERERPRSIRLKPQEYLLLIIAALVIAGLVIYHAFKSYFESFFIE